MSNRGIIVMADNDMAGLTVIENSLSGIYRFYSVSSGRKLFELLKTVKPDLILLGMKMPDSDGYEIIEKLKKMDETGDVPVIFMTKKADPAAAIKGFALGAADYLTAPFSPRHFFRQIERTLRPYNAIA
jgi:two-component system phosphate regulon response regulator PhoB